MRCQRRQIQRGLPPRFIFCYVYGYGIMLPTTVIPEVCTLIQSLEAHPTVPCSTLRITDKANRRHLPDDAQDTIIELQYLLNEHFNDQDKVDALLKYCAEQGLSLTCTNSKTDTWGLCTFFLILSKGKIWFG